nr:MAG TPA: hypothetical protein [Caudoviricetes sp.]DAS01056.1 MAG TPA: hypothetical protein [Caudoviricetes sp.]DAU01919.1 MAG TPA: hypothetical protein [Caudoviricetes sp.]DAX75903.1 MAG TPA: hypothetical protein [Caudoviricetes sp.]
MTICHFVTLQAFYPIVLIVSYKFSIHFHPRLLGGVSDTRGGIIFIHPLCVTLFASLSQSCALARYCHVY